MDFKLRLNSADIDYRLITREKCPVSWLSLPARRLAEEIARRTPTGRCMVFEKTPVSFPFRTCELR